VALALATGLLLLTGAAGAERATSIAYHGLRFLGLDAAQESGFQQTLRRSLEQRKVTLDWRGAEVSLACKRDLHCHCRQGRERKATQVLYGNIGRMGETFTFELVLLDTQSCAAVSSVFLSEAHEPAAAQARLGALLARLTTPLESVSETVVKDQRDVNAVPAIVTVFTQQQLRNLGITSLSELLRLVPGFEVVDTNSGDSVLHHGLAATILYLIDGIPLSNPLSNFSVLGQDFRISLNHLERVELVRGPGSVLYGPNAFLGMVNFITRMPTETSPRITAQASYGTLNTADLYAAVEQSHRWFRYHVSATVNLTSGPSSLVPNSPYGDQPDLIWGNSGTTSRELHRYWDLNVRLEILRRLQFGVTHIDHHDPFQISAEGALLAEGQGGSWQKWHRLYTLAWEDTIRRGFRYRLAASRFEHRLWENWVSYPASPAAYPKGLRYLQGNEVDPQVSHTVEARLYHTYQGLRWGSQLLVGASYMHQRIPDSFAAETGIGEPATLKLDFASRRFQTVAGFLQEELGLWSWLRLTGGVRLEWRDPYGVVVTPQGGLLVGTPRFHGKLIYAEGFRPPSANDGRRRGQPGPQARAQPRALARGGHAPGALLAARRRHRRLGRRPDPPRLGQPQPGLLREAVQQGLDDDLRRLRRARRRVDALPERVPELLLQAPLRVGPDQLRGRAGSAHGQPRDDRAPLQRPRLLRDGDAHRAARRAPARPGGGPHAAPARRQRRLLHRRLAHQRLRSLRRRPQGA